MKLIALLALVLLAGCSTAAAPAVTRVPTVAGPTATPVPTQPPATPWYPDGFDVRTTSGGDVALRWLKPGEFKCTYDSGSCFGMYAIPRSGCPSSLYVEVTLSDAAGTAVGFTNDTAGGVAPGQQAKLVFDTFDNDVTGAKLTKVSCY